MTGRRSFFAWSVVLLTALFCLPLTAQRPPDQIKIDTGLIAGTTGANQP